VLNLASGYAAWLRLADALTGLAGAEKAAVFGGNAARFYGVAGGGVR
jgi:predicted TIM-barrel fold metal-dependent hydrolase